MDSTAPAAPEPASRAAQAAGLSPQLGEELGAPLRQEVRESALLLGLTLVVLGLVAALASTTLLLG